MTEHENATAAAGDCTMACVTGHTNEPGCAWDTTGQPEPTRADAERVDAVRRMEEAAPMTDAELADANELRAKLGILRAELKAAKREGELWRNSCLEARQQRNEIRKERDEARAQLAELAELTTEYGIRAEYVSTLTAEGPVADTLAGALDALDQFDAQGRDVVSRKLRVRKVGTWRDLEEVDGRD